MEVGTGGHRGQLPSNFSKIRGSAPFRLTWLTSLKILKMQKGIEKYTFPAISKDLSFKVSQGACPRTPQLVCIV